MADAFESRSFSSPEPRSFWPAAGIESSGFVQHQNSAIHGFPVKSGKSDWPRIRNEYSAHAQKIESGQSSRSLPQVRRIVALETKMNLDENGTKCRTCAGCDVAPSARESRISFPDAAILLVSDRDHDLWPGPSPEVRDSRTFCHSAHVQSQVCQIWLVLVSVYCVYTAIQNRNVVGPGQGSDISSAWQEGPLETRLGSPVRMHWNEPDSSSQHWSYDWKNPQYSCKK